jgi:hypothetical protein
VHWIAPGAPASLNQCAGGPSWPAQRRRKGNRFDGNEFTDSSTQFGENASYFAICKSPMYSACQADLFLLRGAADGTFPEPRETSLNRWQRNAQQRETLATPSHTRMTARLDSTYHSRSTAPKSITHNTSVYVYSIIMARPPRHASCDARRRGSVDRVNNPAFVHLL